MRFAVLFLAAGLVAAQQSEPDNRSLTTAYDSLRAKDYDTAVSNFLQAIVATTRRASIRKDLAYTYLKIGENDLAREQFREAMRIDPADTQVALEYAFLCYETHQQAQARRIFDRVRKTGNSVAEQAFQNIDAPLAAGIARWQKAIALGSDSFSTHYELATLAEQRDELPLAAEHYEKAWRLLPDRRSVLVDLGRVWQLLNRVDDANAALLAASRGGESRAAEMARELLPDRYPHVPEFRRALQLDPANNELRRELAYLLLKMNQQTDAEREFHTLTETAPTDLLSATQLAFLLESRGQNAAAKPLFDRVLSGADEDLANRVRAVLHLPQVLKNRPEAAPPTSIDAKIMAERSIKAGYMKDALQYLQVAHEADPGDFDVMLKLGWTYNVLRQDLMAVRWFDLARKSTDPHIASEAGHAWSNLRGATQRFRISAWIFPVFSTRWHDLFSYGQVKADMRTGLHVRPYISARFVGDTRLTIGAVSPQYLSESSVIVAVGAATTAWHGATLWGEAGWSISYVKGHMVPDYRGGVSFTRGVGHSLRGETPGWFADTTADAVYVSRFDQDFLVYTQSRGGFTAGPKELRAQIYWNGNLTFDRKREDWANFVETGPGIRLGGTFLPPSMYFTFNLLRGAYLIHDDNRRPAFNDFRAGLWYAFTH